MLTAWLWLVLFAGPVGAYLGERRRRQAAEARCALAEALVAAERQRAEAAETIAEDWRWRADDWRMDAHAQQQIACVLDPARRVS